MESRAFIREAQSLITRIEQFSAETIGGEELTETRETLQKDITGLFNGLGNPSLMVANSLCEAAMKNGFAVKVDVQNRLREMELRLKSDNY